MTFPISSLPVGVIRTDGGTQSRAELPKGYVAELAAALSPKEFDLPPVEVCYDGTDHWLWDGHCRHASYVQAGRKHIFARIRPGTLRDAVLLSCGANATHGWRRTPEDLRRQVWTLLNDPEWGKWSNSEIARRCHVNEGTIRRIRAEADGASSAPPKIAQVARGGTTYQMDTSTIGHRPTPQEILDSLPPRRAAEILELLEAEAQSDRPPDRPKRPRSTTPTAAGPDLVEVTLALPADTVGMLDSLTTGDLGSNRSEVVEELVRLAVDARPGRRAG